MIKFDHTSKLDFMRSYIYIFFQLNVYALASFCKIYDNVNT